MSTLMATDPEIAERISRFKADLPIMRADRIVRRYVTSGDSYILDDGSFFELRQEIADNFGIHPNDVYLVGSGKLGSSIAPKKRYRPFADTSDLDIAVVSNELFDGIWKDVFAYKTSVGYWPAETEFKDYLFRGWIRPDKLPPSSSFELGDRWWDFFRRLTSSGKYGRFKITAGLYKEHSFLESYQGICVAQCQEEAVRPV